MSCKRHGLKVASFLGSPSLAYSSLFYKGQGWNLTLVVHAHLYGSKGDMRETCTWDCIRHFIRYLKPNTSSHFHLKQYKSSQMIQGNKNHMHSTVKTLLLILIYMAFVPSLLWHTLCITKISTLTNILYTTPSQNVISLMNNNFTDQERWEEAYGSSSHNYWYGLSRFEEIKMT